MSNWLLIENSLLIYKSSITQSKSNYLFFDLDYTLIKPKSKNKFPKDKEDWEFIYNSNIKLKEEYNKNNIIIFTNQSKLNTNDKINDFKYKIENIINTLNIDIQVYISLKDDKYRKPLWYMFNKMLELNNITNIDKTKCLYIGDAGGREKDFSNYDLLFAYNIGITYQTPEEYFLNYPILLKEIPKIELIQKENKLKKSLTQELIILVGYPASGKTYFTKKYLYDYKHINQDELKTLSKCLTLTEKEIQNKKSIVIDNTNPSKDTRKKYLDLCKKYNIKSRCIYFDIDINIIKHLNIYRELIGEKKRIPEIAYKIYKKKFEFPTKEEGYEEIINWNLNLEFKTQKEKEIYLKIY